MVLKARLVLYFINKSCEAGLKWDKAALFCLIRRPGCKFLLNTISFFTGNIAYIAIENVNL